MSSHTARPRTPRVGEKPAKRKARPKPLPPIYVVVDRREPVYDDESGNVAAFKLMREAFYTRNWNEKYRPMFAPYRIVKYVPARRSSR